MKTKLRLAAVPSVLALAISCVSVASWAEPLTGPQILEQTCSSCHAPGVDNELSRISQQRKTPEGWLMTIARMQVTHGIEINNDDRRVLVKYLSDKQGLAPSEVQDVRYAMERRLNTQENYQGEEEEFGQMCARCHSGARTILQRRPAEEWSHLVHFHLGQWASLEYQALSRDRDWFDIAINKTVGEIAKKYPYDSDEWSKWQIEKPAAKTLEGSWSFSGHYTGEGEVRGNMQLLAQDNDKFKVTLDGQYADGRAFKGSGTAVLYNGYEWRANIKVGDHVMRQVFAVVNGEMQGRMFERDRDERGLDFTAAQSGKTHILALQPSYLKRGTETSLTLVGTDLKGVPEFGAGVQVLKEESRSAGQVTYRVKVAADADLGLRTASIGSVKGGQLALYDKVETVKVLPDYSIARIGGNGGTTEKVEGRFDAEAWAVGADGKTPYRVGIMPASWTVAAFDETAEKLEDVRFAGKMQSETGIFTPGDAGPNPERQMSSSNVGNLKVIAEVDDAGRKLQGEGQLIVTVQRWAIPPLP